jgi:hypothetical protein
MLVQEVMPQMAIWKSSTPRQNRTKEEGGRKRRGGRGTAKRLIHSIVSLGFHLKKIETGQRQWKRDA